MTRILAGRRRRRKRVGRTGSRVIGQRLAATVVVGGAPVCIGMAVRGATPTADALSIVFNTRNADGSGNTIRINIFHRNIFDFQLGILGNFSNNSTTGDGAIVTRSDNIASMFNARLGPGHRAWRFGRQQQHN